MTRLLMLRMAAGPVDEKVTFPPSFASYENGDELSGHPRCPSG